jgi:hypothetical protein
MNGMEYIELPRAPVEFGYTSNLIPYDAYLRISKEQYELDMKNLDKLAESMRKAGIVNAKASEDFFFRGENFQ